MTGYHADPHALKTAADQLDDAASELREAADGVAAPADDLGPGGVTEAVDVLAGKLAGRMRSVHTELRETTANLRSAREAYLGADQTTVDDLRRG
jgi:excreted virulence factor EspC (type VII ESX diderm)